MGQKFDLEEAKEESVNSDGVDGEAGGGDNVGADLAHCFFYTFYIDNHERYHL